MKNKKSEILVNTETGEISEESGKLNDIITVVTHRFNKSKRIQQDFSLCPTLAEQHTAHLTDINYLMEKYKPDELAAYIAARTQHRQEILGHNFAQEPSLQEAKNVVYKSRQAFEKIPDEIKNQFKNHVEFLKFIDNPANAEKMLKMGILTKKQIDSVQIPETGAVKKSPETKTELAKDKD